MPYGSGPYGGLSYGGGGAPSSARTITNSWSVSSSISRTLHRSTSISDSWSVSDAMGRGMSRSISDSWSISDSVVDTLQKSRSMSDSWSVSDSVRGTLHKFATISDSWNVSSAAARTVGRHVSMSDSWSVSDVISRHYTAIVSDTVIVSDRMAIGVILNTWAVSDSVMTSIHVSRKISDIVRIVETMDTQSTMFTRMISDNVPVSNSLISSAKSNGRTMIDTWSVSDTVSRAGGNAQHINDSFAVFDFMVKGTARHRDISDSWTVSSSATVLTLSPQMRQRWRISVGRETAAPGWNMGNGSLFTFLSGSPTSGSIAYGVMPWAQSLDEAHGDGGIFTWDLNMAATLRETGWFNEAKQ